MDINAGLIDQRVNAFVELHREALINAIGPEARNDEHKLKSAAFGLMCLKEYRSIDDDAVLDALTEGGQDAGVDALHIGDVNDGEFAVTLVNSKYAQSLDGTKGFPANAIVRVIATVRLIFDPTGATTGRDRLDEIIAEVRSLITDGNLPVVRVMLCNNGKRWEKNGDDEIENSRMSGASLVESLIPHTRLTWRV